MMNLYYFISQTTQYAMMKDFNRFIVHSTTFHASFEALKEGYCAIFSFVFQQLVTNMVAKMEVVQNQIFVTVIKVTMDHRAVKVLQFISCSSSYCFASKVL